MTENYEVRIKALEALVEELASRVQVIGVALIGLAGEVVPDKMEAAIRQAAKDCIDPWCQCRDHE